MGIQKFSRLAISSKVDTLAQIQSLLVDESRAFTRESFADLLSAVFGHSVSFDARALADDMGYQYSSVRSWIRGGSVPHAAAWPGIITWIKDALEKKRIENTQLITA